MKTVKFKNKLNGEQFICNDVRRDKQVIDGIEYLVVHRQNNARPFLMRKDALEPVNQQNK